MEGKAKKTETVELPVEEKLKLLYQLQLVDSEVDKIKILRGELPLEVQDLEDEIAGLETRISNLKENLEQLTKNIAEKKNEIKEAQSLIEKYTEQQNNVRNNREYDSLSKEIEFQTLEIELCEKKIKEFEEESKQKEEVIANSQQGLDERKADLENKKKELDNIISDTQKEEEQLINQSEDLGERIEPRLISAYKRIRTNARNGLAVVTIERDACGGCFNKIPPQRQLDIKTRKKIIVCEYCGRILVDEDILEKEKKADK